MNNSANQDIVNALEEVNQKCIEELHKIYAEVAKKLKNISRLLKRLGV